MAQWGTLSKGKPAALSALGGQRSLPPVDQLGEVILNAGNHGELVTGFVFYMAFEYAFFVRFGFLAS
jgi:hypothetical protein